MTNCTCEGNATGIVLCDSCCERFEEFLGTIEAVCADLTQVMGHTNTTATYGHRTSAPTKLHPDLPINVDAYDKRQAIHKQLVLMCTRVAQETRARYTLSIHGLTNYLYTNIPHLRTQHWAPEHIQQLTKLVTAGTASTDHHQPKTFAGTCSEDDTALYALDGSEEARCRTCGTTYAVTPWKAHAATAAQYFIGTPAQLSRALTNPAYNIDITVNQICMWAKQRGNKPPKLQRANPETSEDGTPLKPAYRLNDILDLHAKKRNPIDGTAA